MPEGGGRNMGATAAGGGMGLTERRLAGFSEQYNGDSTGKARLPEGVEHGSARAAMRYLCTCERCMERRARIRARKNGVRR